ncbi:SpoIIE family protein phosphatase [Streptomyces gibsoniae]|uniref:SpoIIE family protein phosphatase n=1 Tax=Streptomyces gibsoniae TaxID=3075529 RepID=A0ABU2U933_9ACTN|nr:SpoIIE family protein phosphatase [Streptomyces sp. DSM 41699]MDT0469745.1 SpoIIE family protein phosphatase [Streptomyces sp. DSM 41699]
MAGVVPLMIVDGAGVVLRWSSQAEMLLGRSADEVVGRSVTPLLTRPAEAAAPAEPAPDEVVLYDADGRVAAGDLRVRPLLRNGVVHWAVFPAPAQEALTPEVGTVVLQAMFMRAPVGLVVLDTKLRIMSANKTAQTLCGTDTEHLLGCHLADVYGFTSPGEVEAMLRGVLNSGVSAPERELRVRPADSSVGERMVGLSAFRLQDRQGTVLGVAVAMIDVGEREKARARLGVLDSVRKRVGQSLDVVVTCQDVAEALVPGFADVAVVEVVDSVARGEEPPLGPLDRSLPLRRAALRHSGPGQYRQAYPLGDVRALPFPTPFSQALTDLKPRVVTLDADTPWLTADPARAEAIRDFGSRTLLAVPLTLRGTVLGLLSLYRTEQAGSFDEMEVALASEVAAHTALSLDNARRYTREHTIATTVQRHLLAPSPSSQTAVETAHLFLPGDQGADGCWDALALPGARVALALCEVAGEGIYTAIATGQLRTTLNVLTALDLEPDELLARLNDTATRLAQERAALPHGDPLRQQTLTATCVYAVYDPLSRTCTIARAGHPAPMITHPDGTTEDPDLPDGPPLGRAEGPPFAQATIPLAEGSVLAFYTNSLLSASRTGLPSDPDLLGQVLADPHRPLQEMCDDVLYRLHDDARPGDFVLLLARTHGLAADHVGTWQLDHHPSAAGTARAHAQRQLSAWGVDDETAYATEVIVSELVTNAVRYGTPPLLLRIIKDRTLTCEVSDSSPSAPHLRHARTVDEGGRGLFICAQLAQRWGTRYSTDGKTVWTEQALQPHTDSHSGMAASATGPVPQ